MTNAPESMFEPGSTPYGPPAGQASSPPPSPAAPTAPAPYMAPAAAWPAAVAPPKRLKNGLGVASIWVGAFALLVSFSGLYTSIFFILIAGALAVAGVVRTGRPRTAAITGLTLTAMALIIASGVTVSRL